MTNSTFGDLARRDDGSSPFDAIRNLDPDGREWWSARDLQKVMGYARWENLEVPLNRAMQSARNVGTDLTRNFLRSQKIVSGRAVADHRLTRYAAYLVAMNGDPNKPEVAAAQTYFAVRTREAEVAEVDRPVSQLDILAAAIAEMQRIERSVTEAAASALEARQDAAVANARIDAMEGRHNWWSALGYSKLHGLPTDNVSCARLGKVAASFARAQDIEPNKVQHSHYGLVNEFPEHIWDLATSKLTGGAA